MNKKIATGALALALAAGGTAAISHTYAASAQDSSSAAGTASVPADHLRSGKPGPGGQGQKGGPAVERAELASLLNLTEDELKTRQEAGESLAKIAAAQGVDPQAVIDLLVSKHRAKLQEEQAAGEITQAQHDERLAKAQERAQSEIERVFDASKKGPGKGPHGGPGPGIGPKEERAEIASLLGLTEAELKTGREAGKSLADIAGEKGVDTQKIVDVLIAHPVEKLDEQLAAGEITQAQHDERAAEARERAEERISRVFDPAAALAAGSERPAGPRGVHPLPAADE